MTQDEIIEMARQADMLYRENVNELHSYLTDGVYLEDLETFAKLVADKEREKCALLCEEERINATHYSAPTQSNWLAKKIRAQ